MLFDCAKKTRLFWLSELLRNTYNSIYSLLPSLLDIIFAIYLCRPAFEAEDAALTKLNYRFIIG
jgi:hypothetical protein